MGNRNDIVGVFNKKQTGYKEQESQKLLTLACLYLQAGEINYFIEYRTRINDLRI